MKMGAEIVPSAAALIVVPVDLDAAEYRRRRRQKRCSRVDRDHPLAGVAIVVKGVKLTPDRIPPQRAHLRSRRRRVEDSDRRPARRRAGKRPVACGVDCCPINLDATQDSRGRRRKDVSRRRNLRIDLTGSLSRIGDGRNALDRRIDAVKIGIEMIAPRIIRRANRWLRPAVIDRL